MAYLLFVDESGQDRQASPYEVLAGAAVHDSKLWDLVCGVQESESRFFGDRITEGHREIKSREFLKRKVFRHAGQLPPISSPRRTALARETLNAPESATHEGLTALAQAKIAFCENVLELCRNHDVRFFASIVAPNSPRPESSYLRKDYSYLFERYFYFVDEQAQHERGLVIFDELERSRAHILVDQMGTYFRRTEHGRTRSERILPEPLFVHSDLTTGIMLADLAAYVISWNVRVANMDQPARSELDRLGRTLLSLRHKAVVPREGYPDGFHVWSFAVIHDLRPSSQQQVG